MSKRSPHIGMGTASLIVIFTVLCLTVFALLTLLTARNEHALAVRTAETVHQYYEADIRAAHICRAVEQAAGAGDLPAQVDGIALEQTNGEVHYACPIRDTLRLAVTLSIAPDSLAEVRKWQTEPAGDWQADTKIEVWDGEGE